MKHLLASLMLMMLVAPAIAEEQTPPTSPSTNTEQAADQKVEAATPKETTNIVDYCRTHTC